METDGFRIINMESFDRIKNLCKIFTDDHIMRLAYGGLVWRQ